MTEECFYLGNDIHVYTNCHVEHSGCVVTPEVLQGFIGSIAPTQLLWTIFCINPDILLGIFGSNALSYQKIFLLLV